jgi:arsenate reductase (thioredoxin)
MSPAPLSVLFLCTGNSARSILAEAVLNDPVVGQGRFTAYSAGSHPRGAVNPFALDLLNELGLPTAGLRSKSWDEFAAPTAPRLDVVVTVCDDAASETCPVWPGHPATAHWGLPDPAAVEGDAERKRAAFRDTYTVLRRRIGHFTQVPFASLDPATVAARLREIGRS